MRLFLINFILRFFALLPLPLNHAIGSLIGLFAFYTPSSLRKISQTNIDICFPTLSDKEKKTLLLASLKETGKTLTETGPMWLWPAEKTLGLIRKIHNEEIINAALDSGKGVILMTPHLGSWEVCGLYLGNKMDVTTLYRAPKIKELDQIIRDARNRTGAQLVPTDGKGMRALLKALKKGHATGILPDQVPDDPAGGVYAPFFNIPVRSMNLVSKLVERTGAVAVIGYAKRLPRGQGYEIYVDRLSDDFYSDDDVTSVTALNQSIEELIKQSPAQYEWGYKRFKEVGEGYPDYYKNKTTHV